MNCLKHRTIAVFFTLALILPGSAQIPKVTPSDGAATAQSPASQPAPEDQLGRSTPYGTVKGFLSAAEDGDFARASKYLDSQQTPERKQEIARQLKLVMDRGLRVDLEKLSGTSEGDAGGDLEPNYQASELQRTDGTS